MNLTQLFEDRSQPLLNEVPRKLDAQSWKRYFPEEPNRDEYLSTHCLCSAVSGTEQPLASSIARKAESTESPSRIKADATIIDERPIPARQ